MVFSFLMEAAVFPTDSQNVDLMAAIILFETGLQLEH